MKRLFLLTIPIMALMVRYDLWAEPEPPKVKACTVEIAKTEPQIELEVETLENDSFDRQIDLLCRCVQAEAGNQSALGKRLVCDVILNRVASETFPDGIEDVIYQDGQFGVVSNGSIDNAEPTAETVEAVLTEMNGRIDTEILYFQTGGYSQYGEKAYQVDKHYFSK